jgi:uncharacterized protein YkwD
MQRPVILLLACSVLLAGQPARAQKPADVEKAIFESSNAYREKKEVGKLSREATLDKIAQGHAQAMARMDRYGDDDRNGHIVDGKGPRDRVKAGGYEFLYLAENVGWNRGFKDPAGKIMNDWIRSPLHQKNLLTKTVTQTGIGAAKSKSGRWYFVQLFARPFPKTIRIKVAIENRTGQTIKFQIGSNRYELKADQKATFNHSQAAGKVQIRITWPDVEAAQTSELADKTRYAFVEKKKGVFEFTKVGAL